MAGGRRNRRVLTRAESASNSLLVNNNSNHLSTAATTNSLSSSALDLLTKEQLKAECRRRGQKSSGNKVELLQRLGHKMSQNNSHLNNAQTTTRRKETVTLNGDNKVHQSQSVAAKREREERDRQRDEREKIVLWKHPLITLEYCMREILILIQTSSVSLFQYKKSAVLSIISSLVLGVFLYLGGPNVSSSLWWAFYWTGLGLLSSVGLGTGLHTFLLYLGPHIAKVTLAAYECGALNFPEPPYPDEIVCPDELDPTYLASIWNIMTKVRVEAMLWGAGTALGELPPYFMARAARRSGYDPDDEDDLREFEELQRKKLEDPGSMTLLDRAKLSIEKLVEKVGFLGILACASIPNPLFDLAGITCGHFLVPFWTFFGATLIGKAIIKMHIQKMFVIIAFNETLLENAVRLLADVPVIGKKLQEPFKEFLNKQKTKLHRKPGSELPNEASGNLLASLFEKFVIAMIFYFLISIVNSLAQSYHKRIHKKIHASGKTKQLSD